MGGIGRFHFRLGMMGVLAALLSLEGWTQSPELLAEGLEPVAHLPARYARSTTPLAYPFRAVSSGPVLEILDESQTSHAPVASLLLPSNIVAMSYSSGRLGLALGSLGFQAVDVSNPLAPRLKGRYSQPSITDVELSPDGETAYLLIGSRILEILNLKDPASPRLANSRSVTGSLMTVGVVSGNTLVCAAEKKGVAVFSLADPRKPKRVSTFNDLKAVYRVAASGRLVAAFDAEEGLVLLDYASWSAPKRLGALPLTTHAWAAAFSESDPSLLLIAEGTEGIRAVNVADPLNPLSVAQLSAQGPALDVSPSRNGLCFAACGEGGFWRYPSLSSAPDRWLEGSLPVGALAVRPPYAYLAVDSKIQTWDFSIPHAPSLVGSVDLPLPAVYLAIHNQLLFASCQQAGVLILDLAAGPLPAPLGTFTFEGSAVQTSLAGNLLAVAAGGTGVVLADLSNPSAPTPITTWTPSAGSISGVAFSSPEVLWVANSSTGIRSLDVANPSNPSPLSEAVSFDSKSGFLYVQGNFVLQPSREAGINVLDISDPAHPKGEGTVPAYSSITVAPDGSALAVADGMAGLTVMAIEEKAKSFPIARFGAPGFAFGVGVLANGLYLVSCREGGVWVLQRTFCDGPVLRLPCDGAHLPATGAPIFHWLPSSGAKYVLKVSTDPSFPDNAKKTFVSSELNVPGYITDLPWWKWMLKRGAGGTATLYWKVVTIVGGNRTASEIRTFRIG